VVGNRHASARRALAGRQPARDRAEFEDGGDSVIECILEFDAERIGAIGATALLNL
jgi:hypothetical protein